LVGQQPEPVDSPIEKTNLFPLRKQTLAIVVISAAVVAIFVTLAIVGIVILALPGGGNVVPDCVGNCTSIVASSSIFIGVSSSTTTPTSSSSITSTSSSFPEPAASSSFPVGISSISIVSSSIPVPEPSDPVVSCPASIRLTCDNEYKLYVNGVFIGNGFDWTQIQEYQINLCNNTMIMIQAENWGGVPYSSNPAGFIAEITIAQNEFIVTNSNWYAVRGYHNHDLNNIGWVEHDWNRAQVYASYGNAPWYNIGMTSPATKWIWTPGGNTSPLQKVSLAYIYRS
jgi:hypothetical protein